MRGVLTVLGLALAVSAVGQEQSVGVDPDWPCVSSRRVDPSYAAISEATGGQMLLFQPSETAGAGVFMVESMRHEETVFRALAELGPETVQWEFPVDSTIASLLITVSLQCTEEITIVGPDGVPVAAGSPGVEDHRFRAVRITRIESPQPGLWSLRAQGSGLLFASVLAKGGLALDQARFVEWRGRPGHEGYFPMKGTPRLNAEAVLEVELSEAPAAVRFYLLGVDGALLEEVALRTQGDAYRGKLRVRHRVFRLAVTGRDGEGYGFLRLHPFLFQASY